MPVRPAEKLSWYIRTRTEVEDGNIWILPFSASVEGELSGPPWFVVWGNVGVSKEPCVRRIPVFRLPTKNGHLMDQDMSPEKTLPSPAEKNSREKNAKMSDAGVRRSPVIP